MEGKMEFKLYPCGTLTDKDETKCPRSGHYMSGNNHEVFSLSELVSAIRQGRIALGQVWTKEPGKLREAITKTPFTSEGSLLFHFLHYFLKNFRIIIS